MKSIEDIRAAVSGALRVTAFLAMTVFLIPFLLLYKHYRHENLFYGTRLFHKVLLKVMGIRVYVKGAPSTKTPVLFVANHASYLDIPVLGSLLLAAFVAKADVASWPLFGFLSKVQDTVFIERRSIRANETLLQLQDHFAQRRNLILFPEGTSSDGQEVLPFKSSLFRLFETQDHKFPLTIQPVSITCTHLDGFPILREERPLYAWFGDMTLPPHLWNAFKKGRFTVEVIFHDAFCAPESADRKELAATCQQVVARGIEQSITGRISS